jgi:hypothetical protein
MRKYVYDKANGEYCLYLLTSDSERTRVFSSSSIAILYDKDTKLLHKHGEPKCVRHDYERMHVAFRTSLVLVESSEWDLEQLNGIIEEQSETSPQPA